MGKIRAFIAIEFPDEIVKEVARIQELLGKRKFVGKLTEPENLHLTLKFLGDVDPEVLEKIRARLREIKFEKFNVRLGDIGTFSYRGKPRIVWIKVLGKGVFELQKKVDDALAEFGFAREERFMSHLTVARIKYVPDLKGFYEYVKGLGVKKLRFDVGDFKLNKSELNEIGPRYELLEVLELQ